MHIQWKLDLFLKHRKTPYPNVITSQVFLFSTVTVFIIHDSIHRRLTWSPTTTKMRWSHDAAVTHSPHQIPGIFLFLLSRYSQNTHNLTLINIKSQISYSINSYEINEQCHDRYNTVIRLLSSCYKHSIEICVLSDPGTGQACCLLLLSHWVRPQETFRARWRGSRMICLTTLVSIAQVRLG